MTKRQRGREGERKRDKARDKKRERERGRERDPLAAELDAEVICLLSQVMSLFAGERARERESERARERESARERECVCERERERGRVRPASGGAQREGDQPPVAGYEPPHVPLGSPAVTDGHVLDVMGVK